MEVSNLARINAKVSDEGGQRVSPVLSLVPVVPAITRSVLIKETIAQYSESDIGCAGLLGGRTQHHGWEYTCTSTVSTTLLLIQC